ncbi:MAG: thiamine phosphate synthase [Bacillota bacterium]|nr:thiamine phosphate synthase [Bacillota bacterium]
MEFSKENLMLYAVTDRGGMSMQDLYNKIEEGLKGGVTMVQLREKELDVESFVSEAIRIKKLCHSYNVPFIVNDNVEVALKSGADGVHVGIEDRPVSEIRELVGKDFIIGATAKTIEQAQNAQAAGADYLGVGAVFPSPTKKKVIRITHYQLREICASVSIPAVAIGGINVDNMDEISGGGMVGIAVSSALFAADDVKSAAELMKEKVRNLL